MVTITLDERDEAILQRLREGDADVESLAESASCSVSYLQDRLPELADNGLVEHVGEDRYAVTSNGTRAITGSPAGNMDDRIDTPGEVEDAIDSLDLRPDREEALRNAYSFVHYWGEAFESEIIDGVYSENPACFESSEEWWDGFVRDRLADLPRVEPPEPTGEPWRYTGTATVDEPTEDGRLAPDEDPAAGSSVKYALEQSDLNEDEKSAVRAAFSLLLREGQASANEIRNEVYLDYRAGYDSADEWWAGLVCELLGSLPGVERAGGGGDVWRYHEADEGTMASEPGADVPGGPLGPEGDG